MKKLSALFLSLVLALEAALCLPLSAFAGEAQTRTVMLYLVGSNLEEDACATLDLIECMEADNDEKLNLIVITGGAKLWYTEPEYLEGADEIDPQYNQIWRVEGKKENEEHGKMTLLEPTGLENTGAALMTNPSTLIDFIDYCYLNYPADQYDIILWNHGGGPAGGFGYDCRGSYSNGLNLSDLTWAFSETKLVQDGKLFEIINFDACLMSSAEIVVALSEFAENLVLSPELEPGYGQEYTGWLNAVKANPDMDGYALGKEMVLAFEDYYSNDYVCDDVTLSVINVKNFMERLLGSLCELDRELISEAKNVGKRNNRYNFYDELYSLEKSFAYSYGDSSLFDLGNFAGALSVPQSEMNNITTQQIHNAQNVYTQTALDILSVLRDNDNSGDDVIYAYGADGMNKTITSGYLRNAEGEVVWAEDYGKIKLPTTGMSIYLGNDEYGYLEDFVAQMVYCAELSSSPEVKEYLLGRAAAAAYYGLIINAGSTVSALADAGEKYINYRKVKQHWQTYGGYWSITARPVINKLVQLGEFEDLQAVEDYLSVIVAQQSKEVVSRDKVAVRKILNEDGSSDSYQVTVSNTSAQAFMSVNASVKLTCSNTDTEELKQILEYVYETDDFDELYPDGITLTTSVLEGELDFADYLDSANDTAEQIYQRIYSSPTNVWRVPEMPETCFALYDDDGNAHLADIQYADKSHETAYVPIVLIETDEDGELGVYGAYIFIAKADEGWEVKGVSFEDSETADRTYTPMDSEIFDGMRYSPCTFIKDDVYDYKCSIPISTFDDVDITEPGWGISFYEVPFDALDDIESVDAHFFVSDVYNYNIDVTDSFDEADAAAEDGDYVLDISLADAQTELAVYNGFEQRPAVSVTVNSEELTEGEDYKVYYFGYVQPGEARIALLGLGDYIGTKYVSFEIVSGWYNDGESWYYYDKTGAALTDWQLINNKWYYFDADGRMQTGWLLDSGKWYYLNASGAMRTGWLLDGGKWYYLKSNGAMATGWLLDSGKWYYLSNKTGAMATGWVKTNGKWYYLESSGAMRTADLTYKGKVYKFNSSGACINP